MSEHRSGLPSLGLCSIAPPFPRNTWKTALRRKTGEMIWERGNFAGSRLGCIHSVPPFVSKSSGESSLDWRRVWDIAAVISWTCLPPPTPAPKEKVVRQLLPTRGLRAKINGKRRLHPHPSSQSHLTVLYALILQGRAATSLANALSALIYLITAI